MMTRPRFRPTITGFVGVLLLFAQGLSPGLAGAANVDDILLERVNQAGSVRVQIDLAAPADSGQAESGQAEEIDRTAEDVLFALPSGSYQAVERQAGSAKMSLQVDAAALDALAAAPEVAAITPTAMPAAMRRLAAGGYHSHAIEPDGSLYAWGYNYYGQLGDGTRLDRWTRGQVLSGVASVATGGDGADHTLAIKTDGSLWTWGYNGYGQLGNGTTQDRWTPASIMSGVSAVAAGAYHSLAVTSDTGLRAWGYNGYGQLGDGSTTDQTSPKLIMYNVADVAAGDYHTLALKTDSSLYAWGNNWYGQLGNGGTSHSSTPAYLFNGVTAIAAGQYHSLALKADDSLWAWGYNAYGQLGDGTTWERTRPVQVLNGVIAMSAGAHHTLALKSDGSLWAWGYNNYGQIGDSSRTTRTSPVQVLSNVAAMSAGGYHSIARKTDGSLWAWGYNAYGQLGDGTTTRRLLPVQVQGFAPILPTAPSNLVASAVSTAQINLTWSDNSSNEQGFRIEGQTSSGTWGLIATVGVNARGYSDTGLSPATSYAYRVRAYNGDGDSANSNTASATTSSGVCTVPSIPITVGATLNEALSTTDCFSQERLGGHYRENFVFAATAGTTYTIDIVSAAFDTYAYLLMPTAGAITQDDNGGGGTNSRIVYRAASTGKLRIQVTSFIPGATGAFQVTLRTQSAVTKPAAPTNLVARAASNRQINLTWRDRSTNEQGFRIERRIGTAAWVQIAEVAANTTSYANIGLSPNTAYRYRVRAFNAGGTSLYATAKAVKTPR